MGCGCGCGCSSQAETEQVVLKVEGMSCGHCKAAVEKAVTALDGVTKVEVDLAAKTASITYAPDKVNVAQMRETIEDQGYDVV